METIAPATLDQLSTVVRGTVWLPSDPGFDAVHRPWNLAIAQDVLAVVEAADAEDVAAVVRAARALGLPVATQPSGHGATGRAAGAILLRTTRLDAIEIDPEARTARIGSGVRSGDLQRAAAAHRLTSLPGSSPVVTVTGAALGGGLSWFGRAFGWISDALLAAEVVDPDGTLRRVTAENDPDLLWALRGGGSELAIVTALELRLQPAPEVFGGRQLWPAAHAHEVARVFRAITETAPDELTVWLELLHFPGAQPMIAIDSTCLGDEQTARRLLAATDALPAPIADTRAAISPADLGAITGEPTDPAPGRSRTELLTRLDDAALAALLDEPIAPLMLVQIRHLGGALARPSSGPHGSLSEPYAVYMFGVPSTPELGQAIGARQDALAASLPVSGRKPITFLRPEERLADALPAAALEWLRLLKQERDPDGVLRGGFPILG